MTRRNGLTMTAILFCVLALCSGSLWAGTLPSWLSGDYQTQGYSCGFELSWEAAPTHTSLDVKCRTPGPVREQTTGKVTGLGPCVTDAYLAPLTLWGSGGVSKGVVEYWLDGRPYRVEGYGVSTKSGTQWIKLISYQYLLGQWEIYARIGSFGDLVSGDPEGGTPYWFRRSQYVDPRMPYPGCVSGAPVAPSSGHLIGPTAPVRPGKG